jgi:hypothetical protein
MPSPTGSRREKCPHWPVIKGNLHTDPQYSQSGPLGRWMVFYFQKQLEDSSANYDAKPTLYRPKLVYADSCWVK